jgi:hypothetical protein
MEFYPVTVVLDTPHENANLKTLWPESESELYLRRTPLVGEDNGTFLLIEVAKWSA